MVMESLNKNKIVPVCKNNKIVAWRSMNGFDVQRYFKIIVHGRTSGSYCDRCGINIGFQFMNKEPNLYKVFYLCDSCYEYKTTKGNKIQTTPDIEDLAIYV